MEKFKLGQKVVISGKLEKQFLSPHQVEKVKRYIHLTGKPVCSSKYDIVGFSQPREGIVVGLRSIVGSRLHYLDTSENTFTVVTKTVRQRVAVVATDLRGLCYVPLFMIQACDDWDEFEDDDFDDLDDLDEDDDFDLDEYEEELAI